MAESLCLKNIQSLRKTKADRRFWTPSIETIYTEDDKIMRIWTSFESSPPCDRGYVAGVSLNSGDIKVFGRDKDGTIMTWKTIGKELL
jgi:hypothetical protein